MYDCVQAPKSISPTILIPPHTSAGRQLPQTRTTEEKRMELSPTVAPTPKHRHSINTINNLPVFITLILTETHQRDIFQESFTVLLHHYTYIITIPTAEQS